MASAPSNEPTATVVDPTPLDRTVRLIASDKKKFKINESAAVQSNTLKYLINDLGDSLTPIPINNVDGATLSMILVYCKKHADPTVTEKDLKAFDKRFVNKDLEKLVDLIWASNYLDIKSLMNILCQKIADLMVGKKPDEIRETFGIENDFTEEEYKKVYDENKWAFEDQ